MMPKICHLAPRRATRAFASAALALTLFFGGEALARQTAEGGGAAREEAAALSVSQMRGRSEGYLADMREVLKDVLKVLEEARSERDIIKLNCVNEKLGQVKGLLKVSEQASVSLQEAGAKGDSETTRHEYTKIAIAREKVSQLRGEAEECIGQLAFVIDAESDVRVEIPSDLPDQDVDRAPFPVPPVVRPPAASQF